MVNYPEEKKAEIKMKLTIVVDNISDSGIKGEWGFSGLVEFNGKKVLIDAGSSRLFLRNMKRLNLDVGQIDYAVLSHAHYDHANGLPALLKKNQKAKLYLREGCKADCYHKKHGIRFYIGIPKSLPKKYSERIENISGDYMLTEGVYVIPHKTEGLSNIGRRENMYRRTPLGWIPDDFSHEQCVVFDTEKGLIIISPCSHGGVPNIINEVKSSFPGKKVYGIIGGFHLFNKPDEEIRALAGQIQETGIEYVLTGHCTKDRAYHILKEELGDKIQQMKAGFCVEF